MRLKDERKRILYNYGPRNVRDDITVKVQEILRAANKTMEKKSAVSLAIISMERAKKGQLRCLLYFRLI